MVGGLVVNDFASGITSSQERTCSLFGGKLPHTAFLINSLVSPERDEAATWRPLYPVLVCQLVSHFGPLLGGKL
jgi:hypothetical protein